jgi:hypothetical protein
MCISVWGRRMIWAEAVLRGNRLKGMILPRQAVPRPFGVDRSPGGSAVPG